MISVLNLHLLHYFTNAFAQSRLSISTVSSDIILLLNYMQNSSWYHVYGSNRFIKKDTMLILFGAFSDTILNMLL